MDRVTSPTERLRYHPDRAANNPPVDRDALDPDGVLHVAQPNCCRCGCGRPVNVGDVYAGEFCKQGIGVSQR